MGWSTGALVFDEVVAVIRANVSDYEERRDIYRELINVFENYDCDNLFECLGSDEAFDEVWKEMYPNDDGDGW